MYKINNILFYFNSLFNPSTVQYDRRTYDNITLIGRLNSITVFWSKCSLLTLIMLKSKDWFPWQGAWNGKKTESSGSRRFIENKSSNISKHLEFSCLMHRKQVYLSTQLLTLLNTVLKFLTSQEYVLNFTRYCRNAAPRLELRSVTLFRIWQFFIRPRCLHRLETSHSVIGQNFN